MIPFLKLTTAPNSRRPFGVSYRKASVRTVEHFKNTFAPAWELVPTGEWFSRKAASVGRSIFAVRDDGKPLPKSGTEPITPDSPINPRLALRSSLFLPSRMGYLPQNSWAIHLTRPRPTDSHSVFRCYCRRILDCVAGSILCAWKRLRASRKVDCQRNAKPSFIHAHTNSLRCVSAPPTETGFYPASRSAVPISQH